MTFIEALELAATTGDCIVSRENMGAHSPTFTVNELGQITVADKAALYLGDLLDLDDWIVTRRP